jgi:DNA gyrase subunit B
MSAESREAAQKAKETLKKEVINTFSCFGKLSHCQSDDPAESELFLVEGDSAGGSARVGRNRKFQAVLPLRGKLLNVERANLNKILSCEEITTLIASLGTGVGTNFNIEKLRYHKIIIMTDADIDGAHIRALLIMFFVKIFPEIVKSGYLYVVRPPLFKISIGKKYIYLRDEIQLEEYLFKKFIQENKLSIIENLPMEQKMEVLKTFVYKCKDFCRFIDKNDSSVDKRILSIVFVYDLFNCNKSDLNEIMNGKVILNREEKDYLKLNIKSIYGNQTFVVKDLKVNWKFSEFPLKLNDKTIYEPYELLEMFNTLSRSGINIQRYKGLGEMNADELEETAINPNNRKIDKLSIPEDMFDEVVDNIKEIMGNEIERRSFVLKNIEDLFGVNWN